MYEAFHDRAAFLILSHSYLGVLIDGRRRWANHRYSTGTPLSTRTGCLENRRGRESIRSHSQPPWMTVPI